MGPMYATVDMQSTAEEKQQAAPRISHYGTFVRGTWISHYGTFVRGTCMAESDFHVVLKAEVARGPVPVAKLESLESRLDHVSERKGLNLT